MDAMSPLILRGANMDSLHGFVLRSQPIATSRKQEFPLHVRKTGFLKIKIDGLKARHKNVTLESQRRPIHMFSSSMKLKEGIGFNGKSRCGEKKQKDVFKPWNDKENDTSNQDSPTRLLVVTKLSKTTATHPQNARLEKADINTPKWKIQKGR